jgi:hypothetical protein
VDIDADAGLTALVDDLEGEVLDVVLNRLVAELLTDETFLGGVSMHVVKTGSRRLTISKMVLWGLLANWFLAASPTRRSSSLKATQEGVIRLPGGVLECVKCVKRGLSKLTLVVDHDLDLSALHDTNARVGCSQINTDDGARDGVVAGRRLGLCGLCQHQTANEDEKKVERDAPGRAPGGAP